MYQYFYDVNDIHDGGREREREKHWRLRARSEFKNSKALNSNVIYYSLYERRIVHFLTFD